MGSLLYTSFRFSISLMKLLRPANTLVMAFLALFSTVVSAGQPVTLSSSHEIYREHCAVCHGDRGDGQTRARFGLSPAPRDFTAPGLVNDLSRARMINSIANGREGTAMVAWSDRMTGAQIVALVDYIRVNFMQSVDVAPGRHTYLEVQPGLEEEYAAERNDPEHLARGKDLYVEHCRVCHGDRGNGATWTNTVLNPSPRNFTSPQSRRIMTRKRMLASVAYGRKDTAMMSFSERLDKENIEEVVDYIRITFMNGPVVEDASPADIAAATAAGGGGHGASTNHGQAPSGVGAHRMPRMSGSAIGPRPPAVDMMASFPDGLVGDFERGRYFYMNNCAACHGVRGDGHGPRASFINPKPRNFIQAKSRATLNRPALFKAIVIGKPGTPMPAWGKVLGPQSVADVAEFVFQDYISPGIGLRSDDETEKEALEAKKKGQPVNTHP